MQVIMCVEPHIFIDEVELAYHLTLANELVTFYQYISATKTIAKQSLYNVHTHQQKVLKIKKN